MIMLVSNIQDGSQTGSTNNFPVGTDTDVVP